MLDAEPASHRARRILGTVSLPLIGDVEVRRKELPLAALRRALLVRRPPKGLIDALRRPRRRDLLRHGETSARAPDRAGARLRLTRTARFTPDALKQPVRLDMHAPFYGVGKTPD